MSVDDRSPGRSHKRTRVRVAVAGLGYWGPQIARNLSDLPGAEVALLCDVNAETLAAVGRRFPEVPRVTRLEDVLSDPSIDAVALATPVSTHYEMAAAALAADKHVFVEKPLAHSVAAARELAETAEKRGLVLMPGHTFLYSPPVTRIKEEIEAGELGEIYFISMSRVNLGLHQPDVSVIWDLAPHDFSILHYWLNERPAEVAALSRACVFPQTPDVAFINVRFPSGAVAHVELSWLSPSKLRRTAIVGSRKMVVYDDTSTEPVKIFDSGASVAAPESFGDYRLTYRAGDILTPKIDGTEPLSLELEDFCGSVLGQREPRSTPELAIEVIRTIDAVDRSLARGGAPVAVDESTESGGAAPHASPEVEADPAARLLSRVRIAHSVTQPENGPFEPPDRVVGGDDDRNGTVKLTAIVPATDRPPTLSSCVAAIRAADDPPEELIVIEEPQSAGPAAARNSGAEIAKGDVLVFVDSDVKVHTDTFSRIRERFDADPQLTAVFGSYDDSPPGGGIVSTFRNLLHHHVHQHAAGPATTFWAGIGAIGRTPFLEAGGFDERFQSASIEDIELGMRLSASKRRIELDPTIQGTHLKQWTLPEMLRGDLLNRGVPWVALLLASRSRSTTLNLSWRHRLSAAGSIVGVSAVAARRLDIGAGALLALVALNSPFYRLLLRRQGPVHAPVAVGLHVLHHLTGAAAVPLGVLYHLRNGRSNHYGRPHPTERGGGRTTPPAPAAALNVGSSRPRSRVPA
jgi:predicted dehydrogenase